MGRGQAKVVIVEKILLLANEDKRQPTIRSGYELRMRHLLYVESVRKLRVV